MLRRRSRAWVVVAVCAAFVVPGCGGSTPSMPSAGGGGGMGGIPGASGCGDKLDIATSTVGDFGSGAGATKLEAFLGAAVAAHKAAKEVEDSLVQACISIGRDIGVDSSRMSSNSAEPGARVQAACGTLNTELRSYIRAHLRRRSKLVLSYQPPVCGVRVDAVGRAAAKCDASVQANAQARCDGQMSGRCTANCSGTCSGSCSGRCEGTCGGQCSGTCDGACDGRCSSERADGSCSGRCSGTCHGTCSATCAGACSGQCDGRCDARCSGGCSVALQEAQCEGNAEVRTSAECRAQANVEAQGEVECTEPSVAVEVSGRIGAQERGALEPLVNAIEESWPKVLVAMRRIDTSLKPALEAFARASARLAGSFGDMAGEIGAEGVACAGAAGRIATGAFASVRASASVSVELNASVSAQGGG